MGGPMRSRMLARDPREYERPPRPQHSVDFLGISRATAKRDRMEAAIVDKSVERPVGEGEGQRIALLNDDREMGFGGPAPGGRHGPGR